MLRTLIVFLLQFSVASAHNNSYGNNTQNCASPNTLTPWWNFNIKDLNLDKPEFHIIHELLLEMSNEYCLNTIFVEHESLGNAIENHIHEFSSNTSDFVSNFVLGTIFSHHTLYRLRFCCSNVNSTELFPLQRNPTISNCSAKNLEKENKKDRRTSDEKKLLLSLDGVVCGHRKIETLNFSMFRYSSEKKVEANEWPWTIAIPLNLSNNNSAKAFCTGSLISKNFVLTAAHCVDESNAKDLRITAGYHKTGQSKKYRTKIIQESAVESIHIHEKYDPDTFLNDIAILRLKTPLVYSKYVQPICLPTFNPDVQEQIFVVGWETQQDRKSIRSFLKQNIVRVENDCRRWWPDSDSDRQICASELPFADCISYAETGGSILSNQHQQYMLTGIGSYNDVCDKTILGHAPHVFTRISYYKSWIRSIVGQT